MGQDYGEKTNIVHFYVDDEADFKRPIQICDAVHDYQNRDNNLCNPDSKALFESLHRSKFISEEYCLL